MGSSASSKTTMPQRRLAEGLRGCLVADAASMGTHWIYDGKKLAELLKGREAAPEFHEPPSCPFYNANDFPGHYESGMPSPYAEEALALMDYMVQEKGNFVSGDDFANSLFAWAQTYTGRKNHATKMFEENVEKLKAEGKENDLYPACGADDAQANAFWKVVVILMRYGDAPDCMEKVEEAIRTHQNHDQAVEYGSSFAKIMCAAANGADLRTAISNGASGELSQKGIDKALSSAIESADEDGMDRVNDFLVSYSHELSAEGDPDMFRDIKSKTCAFPQSFVVGLKLCLDVEVVAAQRGEDFDKFAYAVRRNILAGGDTCGRIPIIAGLMSVSGATAPSEWAGKASSLESFQEYANAAKGAKKGAAKV